MTRPTVRTAHGNRFGLALAGFVLLAAGGYVLARSLGAFGRQHADAPVYADGTADWVHQQRPWLWITIAALAVLGGIWMIRWLLVQLRSDSLRRVALDSDRTGEPGAGRADLPAQAVATAVGREIDDYPGVNAVRTGLTGRPDEPELQLRVTIAADADLAKVRRKITGGALTNARIGLDAEHLPTQLRLVVAPRQQPRRNEI